MRQKNFLVLTATGILLIMLLPSLAFAKVEDRAGVDKDALMKKVSGVQMPFIENQGQIKDKSVRFYANTFAGTVFITDKGEIVYSLVKTEAGTENTEHRQKNSELQNQNSITKAVVLRETLECPEETGIKGVNKSVTTANYFVGSKDNWRTNIPTWQEVSLGEVYEGIELKLRAYGNNVEKLFTVYPGGTSEDIKLNMEGAKGLKVNKSGELEIETALGTVKMTKPVAYQEINGNRVQVAVNYSLLYSQLQTPNSELIYGFQVGKYDHTKPLVIDPLLSSTFIGGSRPETAFALAIDFSGDVFVAGNTRSSNYPTTEGVYDMVHKGFYDVFISKLDSSLSSLLSSTFIGGGSDDNAFALTIDSSGDVFVTGRTESSDYPITEGAYYTTFNGYFDVFVSKLDSSLSSLLSSTFIGGSAYDDARTLAINSSGDVFVAGHTNSSDYPTTEGAFDTTYNGSDVFVSKLDSSLSSLLASTFIGGSGLDFAHALAIGSSGDVFITGVAGTSYPTTEGAYDTIFNGYYDVFVSRLDGNLSSLLSSTFIGGSDYDDASSLAVDSSGDVFVTGHTQSPAYPTTEGAYDTIFNGYYDVFVSRLDGNLSSLLSSTFIGGSNDYDYAFALTIDSSGDVFVAGRTGSSYPTTEGAYDTTFNGLNDVFVSKLDSNLASLVSSTFIGGSSGDSAHALAIDSSGNVFVAGFTESFDYPTTEGAYDTVHNGGADAFVLKLDNDLSAGGNLAVPDISANPASKNFGSVDTGTSSIQIFTISNIGTGGLVIKAVYLTGANPYQFSIRNDTCSGMIIAPSESCTVDAVFSPTKGGVLSAFIGIGSNDPDTPSLYMDLTGTGVAVGIPDISASPASMDFGVVNTGSSVSRTFTISNVGTGYLVIKAAYLTGANPYQFSIENDSCSGMIIAPSESCTFDAVFSPTKEGLLSALIGIGSDDPDTPRLDIELTGTGL